MANALHIPLYPLDALLLPGESMALRVAEPRYRLMVRRCLESDAPFGAVLIASGREAGSPARPHGEGTMARIVGAVTPEGAPWRIRVQGGRRFRIEALDPGGPHPRAWVTFPPTVGTADRGEMEAIDGLLAVYRDLAAMAGRVKPPPAAAEEAEIRLWAVLSRMDVGQLDRLSVLAIDDLGERARRMRRLLEREVALLRLLVEDRPNRRHS